MATTQETETLKDERPIKVKKAEYAEKIKIHKEKIEEIQGSIKRIEKEIVKNNDLSNYGRLSIANSYLNIIAVQCTMSDISLNLLSIKNEAFLNEGRKLLYKVVSVLEDVAGNIVDAPFSEYADKLATIEKLDDRKRLNLFKKLLDSLRAIEDRFGPTSKWKWSFVDLAGGCSAVIKNMIDFKRLQSQRDPRIDAYNEREETLKLVKEILKSAAMRYREKYEMVTHEPTEMKRAILYLAALNRIHTIFNEPNEADSIRKSMQIWQEKIENDMKKADEDKKKKNLK